MVKGLSDIKSKPTVAGVAKILNIVRDEPQLNWVVHGESGIVSITTYNFYVNYCASRRMIKHRDQSIEITDLGRQFLWAITDKREADKQKPPKLIDVI